MKANLIYFGTSDHSVILLKKLKECISFNLKLVVTKEDSVVGRAKKLTSTPVKVWCLENGIDFITVKTLKKSNEDLIKKLSQNEVKIALVADFGLMIPSSIINTFERGIINIHFSLLPKLRGASPVTHALLRGEKETGITFLLTTSEMDKGPILKQIKFAITEPETDETLYKKLFDLAADQVEETLSDYLTGEIKPFEQNEKEATYCTPSGKPDRTTFILKEDARIDWTRSPEEIERSIRAYHPWPVAWTVLGELANALQRKLVNESIKNLRVKIHKAHLDENSKLKIEELQIEGKTKQKYEDFANGYFKKLL